MKPRGYISFGYMGTVFMLITLFLFSAPRAEAQEVSARAATPRTEYLIGEQMAFAIHMNYPERFTPIMGEIPMPPGIEVLDSVADSRRSGSQVGQTIIYTLMGFQPGHFRFPAVRVRFQDGTGDSFSILTDTIGFNINLVDVDTTRDIIPIKEPLEVPYTFAEIVPYIVGALVLILAVIIAIWYYRKWKSRTPDKPEPEVIAPPSEIALQKLQKLYAEKLWESGQVKLYYIRLSTIIREYLEEAFDIDALELTTSQIIELCSKKMMKKDCNELLGELLEQADLVKFAKFKPDKDDMIKVFDMAIVFVEKTSGERS